MDSSYLNRSSTIMASSGPATVPTSTLWGDMEPASPPRKERVLTVPRAPKKIVKPTVALTAHAGTAKVLDFNRFSMLAESSGED